MDIDRQRIAAVHTLEAYVYRKGEWLAPATMIAETDAMHGALMRRADALAGCAKGSDEEGELEEIVDIIEAYEAKRWPLGRDPSVQGGKG